MKEILLGGFMIAGVIGIGWLGVANSWLMSKTFAPKFEQVRRETFEQSQSYVDGQRRDIANLRLDYLSATTAAQRAAIRSTALQRISELPDEALTSDILAFRAQLMTEARQ